MHQIGESIWQFKGSSSGPAVVLLGGVHGNERTGIEVVRELVRNLTASDILITHGTLTLAIGNPKAVEQNRRFTDGGEDLNRCFFEDTHGQEGGSYERVRAEELKPFLSKADVLVDIHATNKPSVPFIASLASSRYAAVYQWLRADRVLTDPKFVLGGRSCTTDDFVAAHGGIGICYESGQASDVSRVAEVEEDVRNMLRDLGMISGKPSRAPNGRWDAFEIIEPIILTGQGFQFADGFGESSFEDFHTGDIIGSHGERPLRATFNGVIVFPKIPEHQHIGAPLAYLAKRSE